MKNLIYSIFICLVFCLSSCSEYGEEVWLNADGSGRYQMYQDLGEMLPLIEMGIAGAKEKAAEKKENGEDTGEINTDQLLAIFESGKIDTTITIESFMKKSFEKEGTPYSKAALKAKFFDRVNEDGEQAFKGTAAEKEKMWGFFEGLLDMKTRIQYDQDYSTLKNTMSQSFTNPKGMLFGNLPELLDIVSKYSDDGKLNDPSAKEAMEKMKDAFPTYEITNNMVKVRRKAIELETDDPEAKQGMEMMMGMMGNSTYTMTIHVPGKVKKVNKPGAKFDGSTVTWTMPALDLYDTSKDLNLDIKFKAKKGIKY